MFVFDRLLKKATSEERRYSTLLWSLLVLFLAYPVTQKLGVTRFWSLLFVGELLLAVYAVSEGKKSLMIACALVTPAVLGELSFFLFESTGTHWFSVVSVTVFLAYVSFVVYKTSVFAPGRITTDRVAGAIATYFLMGLLWGMVYGMIAAVNPESFTGIEAFSLEQPGAQQDFLYFSFVTLTTLGYGDMAPVSSFARTLAWIEAVFGQLYLAVTIARLVSLEVTHNMQPPAGE
jgi:hypothetical protein